MCRSKPDLTVIEFMDFCQDGDVESAKQIYDKYPDKVALLEAHDPDGKTAIHLVTVISLQSGCLLRPFRNYFVLDTSLQRKQPLC